MMTLGWTWRDLMETPSSMTERRLLVESVRAAVQQQAAEQQRRR